MKKIYYNMAAEKEEILTQAKENDWILKEDAVTIDGKYLVFYTRTDEKLKELGEENVELKIQQAQSSMEIFSALSTMNTNNEINQATMMMELLNMIATLQGGE